METFNVGINDEEAKGKGDILEGEEPPYFDMEVTPQKPLHKSKKVIILVFSYQLYY